MFVTLTTTPTIEGRRIVEYKGIVFGEVISGVDFVKDFAAGLTNFFGGRSNSYEGELQKAREQALAELQQRASAMAPTPLWVWTWTMRPSAPTAAC